MSIGMRPILLSLLACVALYNLHQIAGLLGIAPSNILAQSNDGDVWTFVIDKARTGTADLQRIGINLAFAQAFMVWGWWYAKDHFAYAAVGGLWFAIQAAQIVTTCNCTIAEHLDWLMLAVMLATASIYTHWTHLSTGMRVVWNKYFDL